MLKQEYKEPPTLKEALELAVKILNKTLDSAKLNAERGLACCSVPESTVVFSIWGWVMKFQTYHTDVLVG